MLSKIHQIPHKIFHELFHNDLTVATRQIQVKKLTGRYATINVAH